MKRASRILQTILLLNLLSIRTFLCHRIDFFPINSWLLVQSFSEIIPSPWFSQSSIISNCYSFSWSSIHHCIRTPRTPTAKPRPVFGARCRSSLMIVLSCWAATTTESSEVWRMRGSPDAEPRRSQGACLSRSSVYDYASLLQLANRPTTSTKLQFYPHAYVGKCVYNPHMVNTHRISCLV